VVIAKPGASAAVSDSHRIGRGPARWPDAGDLGKKNNTYRPGEEETYLSQSNNGP